MRGKHFLSLCIFFVLNSFVQTTRVVETGTVIGVNGGNWTFVNLTIFSYQEKTPCVFVSPVNRSDDYVLEGGSYSSVADRGNFTNWLIQVADVDASGFFVRLWDPQSNFTAFETPQWRNPAVDVYVNVYWMAFKQGTHTIDNTLYEVGTHSTSATVQDGGEDVVTFDFFEDPPKLFTQLQTTNNVVAATAILTAATTKYSFSVALQALEQRKITFSGQGPNGIEEELEPLMSEDIAYLAMSPLKQSQPFVEFEGLNQTMLTLSVNSRWAHVSFAAFDRFPTDQVSFLATPRYTPLYGGSTTPTSIWIEIRLATSTTFEIRYQYMSLSATPTPSTTPIEVDVLVTWVESTVVNLIEPLCSFNGEYSFAYDYGVEYAHLCTRNQRLYMTKLVGDKAVEGGRWTWRSTELGGLFSAVGSSLPTIRLFDSPVLPKQPLEKPTTTQLLGCNLMEQTFAQPGTPLAPVQTMFVQSGRCDDGTPPSPSTFCCEYSTANDYCTTPHPLMNGVYACCPRSCQKAVYTNASGMACSCSTCNYAEYMMDSGTDKTYAIKVGNTLEERNEALACHAKPACYVGQKIVCEASGSAFVCDPIRTNFIPPNSTTANTSYSPGLECSWTLVFKEGLSGIDTLNSNKSLLFTFKSFNTWYSTDVLADFLVITYGNTVLRFAGGKGDPFYPTRVVSIPLKWLHTVLITFKTHSLSVGGKGLQMESAIDECVGTCSGHGKCVSGQGCLCESGWSGADCETAAKCDSLSGEFVFVYGQKEYGWLCAKDGKLTMTKILADAWVLQNMVTWRSLDDKVPAAGVKFDAEMQYCNKAQSNCKFYKHKAEVVSNDLIKVDKYEYLRVKKCDDGKDPDPTSGCCVYQEKTSHCKKKVNGEYRCCPWSCHQSKVDSAGVCTCGQCNLQEYVADPQTDKKYALTTLQAGDTARHAHFKCQAVEGSSCEGENPALDETCAATPLGEYGFFYPGSSSLPEYGWLCRVKSSQGESLVLTKMLGDKYVEGGRITWKTKPGQMPTVTPVGSQHAGEIQLDNVFHSNPSWRAITVERKSKYVFGGKFGSQYYSYVKAGVCDDGKAPDNATGCCMYAAPSATCTKKRGGKYVCCPYSCADKQVTFANDKYSCSCSTCTLAQYKTSGKTQDWLQANVPDSTEERNALYGCEPEAALSPKCTGTPSCGDPTKLVCQKESTKDNSPYICEDLANVNYGPNAKCSWTLTFPDPTSGLDTFPLNTGTLNWSIFLQLVGNFVIGARDALTISYGTTTTTLACAVDVVLVLDRSGSVGVDGWAKTVSYAKARISSTRFTDATGNRIGVVSFSTAAQVECALSHNEASLLKCINSIQGPDGWTNTPEALRTAESLLSSTTRTRAIEVVTDGKSMISSGDTQTSGVTQTTAAGIKSKGVIIIAVGVSGADLAEINGMASSPASQYSILLPGFAQLPTLAQLIGKSCVPSVASGTSRVWTVSTGIPSLIAIPIKYLSTLKITFTSSTAETVPGFLFNVSLGPCTGALCKDCAECQQAPQCGLTGEFVFWYYSYPEYGHLCSHGEKVTMWKILGDKYVKGGEWTWQATDTGSPDVDVQYPCKLHLSNTAGTQKSYPAKKYVVKSADLIQMGGYDYVRVNRCYSGGAPNATTGCCAEPTAPPKAKAVKKIGSVYYSCPYSCHTGTVTDNGGTPSCSCQTCDYKSAIALGTLPNKAFGIPGLPATNAGRSTQLGCDPGDSGSKCFSAEPLCTEDTKLVCKPSATQPGVFDCDDLRAPGKAATCEWSVEVVSDEEVDLSDLKLFLLVQTFDVPFGDFMTAGATKFTGNNIKSNKFYPKEVEAFEVDQKIKWTTTATQFGGIRFKVQVGKCVDGGCSGHGVCNFESGCECEKGWMGDVCAQEACPNNCNAQNKRGAFGTCTATGCQCNTLPGFDVSGDDCGTVVCKSQTIPFDPTRPLLLFSHFTEGGSGKYPADMNCIFTVVPKTPTDEIVIALGKLSLPSLWWSQDSLTFTETKGGTEIQRKTFVRKTVTNFVFAGAAGSTVGIQWKTGPANGAGGGFTFVGGAGFNLNCMSKTTITEMKTSGQSIFLIGGFITNIVSTNTASTTTTIGTTTTTTTSTTTTTTSTTTTTTTTTTSGSTTTSGFITSSSGSSGTSSSGSSTTTTTTTSSGTSSTTGGVVVVTPGFGHVCKILGTGGKACPAGYVLNVGDISGWGSVNGVGGGEKVASCSECGSKCTSEPECNSFECSVTKLKCNLNRATVPKIRPNQDYMFCSKANPTASCGNGFLLQHGSAPGALSSLSVPNCAQCAAACTANPSCLSYECSPTDKKCNLNDVSAPKASQYKDYMFCTKTIIGGECAKDYQYFKNGDIPGFGRIKGKGGGAKMSCAECAALCTSMEECRSYECTSGKTKCNLNTLSYPSQHANDQVFCLRTGCGGTRTAGTTTGSSSGAATTTTTTTSGVATSSSSGAAATTTSSSSGGTTTGGGTCTAGGQKCIFPCTYKGETMTSCSRRDNNNKPWCCTQVTADGLYISRKWKNCDANCLNSGSTSGGGASTCPTKSGSPCVFPFTYKGSTYTECTLFDNVGGKAWCSTKEPYSGRWSPCDCSKSSCGCSDQCTTTSGPRGGAPCVFPFTYKGIQYKSCTLVDAVGGKPWCSTRATYSGSSWGNCDCSNKKCSCGAGSATSGSTSGTTSGTTSTGVATTGGSSGGGNCGPNGQDLGGACKCKKGWHGETCELQYCRTNGDPHIYDMLNKKFDCQSQTWLTFSQRATNTWIKVKTYRCMFATCVGETWISHNNEVAVFKRRGPFTVDGSPCGIAVGETHTTSHLTIERTSNKVYTVKLTGITEYYEVQPSWVFGQRVVMYVLADSPGICTGVKPDASIVGAPQFPTCGKPKYWQCGYTSTVKPFLQKVQSSKSGLCSAWSAPPAQAAAEELPVMSTGRRLLANTCSLGQSLLNQCCPEKVIGGLFKDTCEFDMLNACNNNCNAAADQLQEALNDEELQETQPMNPTDLAALAALVKCDPTDCNGHGVCNLGNCECASGWEGTGCDTPICPGCGGDCVWNAAIGAGVCTCPSTFEGADCTIPVCSPACEPTQVFLPLFAFVCLCLPLFASLCLRLCLGFRLPLFACGLFVPLFASVFPLFALGL